VICKTTGSIEAIADIKPSHAPTPLRTNCGGQHGFLGCFFALILLFSGG
jgi:hypothetical protein